MDTATGEGSRPQAERLPPKIGELDFVPIGQPIPREMANDPSDMFVGPHPAESSAQLPLHPQPLIDSTAPSSVRSKKSFVKFLRNPRPIATLSGIRVPTLIRLIFLSLSLIGTIISWTVTIIVLTRKHRKSANPDASGSGSATMSNMNMSNSAVQQSLIFIHVAFGVIVLALILLLERTIFIVRAERLHFAAHPSSFERNDHGGHIAGGNVTMPFAPWNRPTLPSYANALDYRGTGDVEDQHIAGGPPPQYGNTRGSRLLLSNVLRQSLIEQSREDRPLSYTSRVESREEGETREDARRARDLEGTLATLELGQDRQPSIPHPAMLR